MAADPLTFRQGQTLRVALSVQKELPDAPALTATVTGNIVMFGGAGSPGLTVNVEVTRSDGLVIPFSVAVGDDWTLAAIAGAVGAQVAYTDANPALTFTSLSLSDTMFEVGTPSLITAVSVTIAQSSALNLTGATARMMVRKTYGGPPLLTLTTENGGLTIDPDAGTVSFLITPAQSAALPISYAAAPAAGPYTSNGTAGPPTVPVAYFAFDIEITDANSNVSFTPEQILTMNAAVTRP